MQSSKALADYEDPIVKETALRLIAGKSTIRDKLRRFFSYVRDDIVFAFPKEGDLVKASEPIQRFIQHHDRQGTALGSPTI